MSLKLGDLAILAGQKVPRIHLLPWGKDYSVASGFLQVLRIQPQDLMLAWQALYSTMSLTPFPASLAQYVGQPGTHDLPVSDRGNHNGLPGIFPS